MRVENEYGKGKKYQFSSAEKQAKEIIKTLENLKVKIKQKYKAEAVGIFGSFVK